MNKLTFYLPESSDFGRFFVGNSRKQAFQNDDYAENVMFMPVCCEKKPGYVKMVNNWGTREV